MSYSFNVKAATKSDALAAVAVEMDKVVVSQPVHAADKQPAQDVARTFVGMLRDPGEGESVSVNVWGSLSWEAEGVFTSANVGVNASITRT